MIVIAWNNGAHSRTGIGYGFRVNHDDRAQFFKPEWDEILLEIDGEAEPVKVALDKEAFWSEKGQDLVSVELGKWLRKNGLAPWPRQSPPVFVLDPVQDNRFKVSKARQGRKVF
ncbi:MAG TPA: hypothetical protein PJ988_12100 [Anaerolinea sp.]|nr:hypothetical protein [Anaerolinea sp.]